jgi:hypothetical protein
MNALANKSFQDGVQYVWDATSITLADTCLRKYQLKMIEGWTYPQRSVHLIFGGLYATALEHYYKHRASGLSSQESLILVVQEALYNSWNYEVDEHGQPIPDTGAPIEFAHNAKTRENLIRTIVWYVDQFEDESIEVVHLATGKPAVELSFTLPVDSGIFFAGHIDRLVEYSGDKYVMDQKTTGGTITSNYFDGFNPDIQMSMYTFAGRMIYNIPVKGVIIDAAQINVGFTRFERGFTFRSDSQLDEWYAEVLGTIERTQAATRRGFFPKNTTACGNYGGCEFRRVCSRSPEVRKNFLAADFVRGPTWDPLDRR